MKHGPYSFSRLFDPCDYKFMKTYIERAKGLEISRFGTNAGSASHRLAEVALRFFRYHRKWPKEAVNYVIEKDPSFEEFRGKLHQTYRLLQNKFEFDANIMCKLEAKYGMTMDLEPGEWESCDYRGVIDYHEIWDNRVRIVDFKNYPRVHSDGEIADVSEGVGAQLMSYLALVMVNNPNVYWGTYEVYYFRFGTSRGPLDDEGKVLFFSREEVLDWWKNNVKDKIIAREGLEEFKPKPSAKSCQYCPFIHVCPLQLNENEFIIRDKEDLKKLAQQQIVLEEKRKRVKSAIKNYVDNHEEEEVVVGNEKIGHVKSTRKHIDVAGVLKLCLENKINPAPFLSLSPTRYKSLRKLIPKDKLEEYDKLCVEETYTRRKLK